MSGSGTGIVTPYNTHRGIDLDGAAAYTRAADLAGSADSPRGIISGWFRVDGGNGTARSIISNTNARMLVRLDALNRLQIYVRTAGNVIVVESLTTPTYLAGSGWHSVAMSWDTTVPVKTVLVDGAVPALTTDTANAGVLDYTRPAWTFGNFIGGISFWDGGLHGWYVNTAEYIDLTAAVNQVEFRHPNGQPPSLLADGSGPTGTQPIMYMVEEGGVIVNRGSGGVFVTVGAPAVSADSPKDRWVASLNYGTMGRLQSIG